MIYALAIAALVIALYVYARLAAVTVTIRRGRRRPGLLTCLICALKTGWFAGRTLRYTPGISLAEYEYEDYYKGWHKITGRTDSLRIVNPRKGSERFVHRAANGQVEVALLGEGPPGQFDWPERSDVIDPGEPIDLSITGTGWPCIPWTAARPAEQTYSFELK